MIIEKLQCALSKSNYPEQKTSWMAMFFNSAILELDEGRVLREFEISTMVAGAMSEYVMTFVQKEGYKPIFRDGT